MSTLEQWLYVQAKLGRHLYLMLDCDGQLEECNVLAGELGIDRYRNLYLGTPADSLAKVGPRIFFLESTDHPIVQALLKSPERHWGWLASTADNDLDALTSHWQERLVTGERPNQALYRLHDNRVLGRALAYLRPEQFPEYLGPITSVCYWQAEQWSVAENPAPKQYPLPASPAWLNTPTPPTTYANVLFDNCRRYLMREHTGTLVELAAQQDIDTWLRSLLDLADTWGWHEPEPIHFLLTQSLQAPGYVPPKSWLPRPNETPELHFERLHQEAVFWQGGAV
ncbi:hypothetical protein J2W83_001463 [Pseudomonas hunanensis]|uniref:Uncharacterized protein n=1 Tax=Pseudomonas hunanensis TaxID=1247546 RepID=A0ACC6K083_9PSED|nr:DUF4123 domain-containing protein [Pseudomonas hunanensis]MDR6711868.1 hypothetical protein [Pseudomonas hunanensis]